MNRIQRIAVVAALGITALGSTAGVAFGEPRPWHESHAGTSHSAGLGKPKAQIEHEELLRMTQPRGGLDDQASSAPSSETDGVPWQAIGLAAVGAATVTAGTIVVVRHGRHQAKPA